MRFNPYDEMLPVIIFLVAFYGVLLLFVLANYILRGIGILRMSRSRGLQYGWLGFIPIASEYQLGSISGEIELGNKKMRNPGLWMALLPVIIYGVFFTVYIVAIFSATGLFSLSSIYNYGNPDPATVIIPMVTIILIFYILLIVGAIFITIIRLLALHRIFACHSDGQRPVFHTILSAFVPFAEAILLIKTAKKPIIHPPAYMCDYANPYQQPYYPQQQPYNPAQIQPQQPFNPPQIQQQPYSPQPQEQIQQQPQPYNPPPVQNNEPSAAVQPEGEGNDNLK